MSNPPKINPTAIYLCLMGHGTLGSTIPTGARLRGSELLALKDDPTYYIEEPFSDSERLAVIRERWPGYVERLGTRP